jgi:hypothetical protein
MFDYGNPSMYTVIISLLVIAFIMWVWMRK